MLLLLQGIISVTGYMPMCVDSGYHGQRNQSQGSGLTRVRFRYPHEFIRLQSRNSSSHFFRCELESRERDGEQGSLFGRSFCVALLRPLFSHTEYYCFVSITGTFWPCEHE